MYHTDLKVNLNKPWIEWNNVLTAPATLITVGIHCGSGGCLLYTEDALKNSASAWNGIPLCLNHPMVNGKYVSINHSEEIRDKHEIGFLSNVRYERRSLRGTINIPAQYRHLWPGIQELREVSIGVFTEDTEALARHGGENYKACVIRIKPDHLALLTSEKGACSWEDGCGIRANCMALNPEILLPIDVRVQEDFRINASWDDPDILLPISLYQTIRAQQSHPRKPTEPDELPLLPIGMN